MRLFAWLRNLRKPLPSPRGRLCCSDCGCPIHKYDRYTITAVKHKNCMDKKMVGQESFPAKGE